jgi:hypothetical protein
MLLLLLLLLLLLGLLLYLLCLFLLLVQVLLFVMPLLKEAAPSHSLYAFNALKAFPRLHIWTFVCFAY